MNEREAARLFNERLDRHLAGAGLEEVARSPADEAGLWTAAARLAALPDLLPGPDAAFEQRVWAGLRPAAPKPGWTERLAAWRPGLAWRVLAPTAALLLLVLFALPGPRQAMSNWMASFGLGEVEVVVAPEERERPELAVGVQQFDSAQEARAAIGYAIAEPAFLPPDYRLDGVEAVSLPQVSPAEGSFYVDLSYRPANADPFVGAYLVLRQYGPAGQAGVALDQIEFQAETVRTASDVTLPNGLAAVLVEFDAAAPDGLVVLRQLIWEQRGRTMELWSEVLAAADLLDIAASVP